MATEESIDSASSSRSDGSSENSDESMIEVSPEEIDFISKFFDNGSSQANGIEFRILLCGAQSITAGQARDIIEEALTESDADSEFSEELWSQMERALIMRDNEYLSQGITAGFVLRLCASIL